MLEWVMELPVAVQAQPKVTLLAQVFDEYFERVEQVWRGRRQRDSGGIQNPHEPGSAVAAQRQEQDVDGLYQVQVAETAAEQPVAVGEPTRQFVMAVETQRGDGQRRSGAGTSVGGATSDRTRRPSKLYVDGAYVSATAIVAARAQGWELLGRAQPSASTGPGYRAKSLWWTSRRARRRVRG